jgi:hypothetical protein
VNNGKPRMHILHSFGIVFWSFWRTVVPRHVSRLESEDLFCCCGTCVVCG